MFLPNEGVGAGQHTRALWREHVAALAKVRQMPGRGHGFGSGPGGTAAFDVTNVEGQVGCLVKYKNTSVGSKIHKGCPVWFDFVDLFADLPDGIETPGEYISQASKAIPGSPTPSGATVPGIAKTLSSTAPGGGGFGSVGLAWVAGIFPAIICHSDLDGETSADYVAIPSSGTNSDIADESEDDVSGGLVPRHTGNWKILEKVSIPDTELSVALLHYRGTSSARFFVADITASTAIGDLRYKYTWAEEGAGAAASSNTDFAYNRAETYNETDDYASSQLKTNMGDWEIQPVRRRVLMRLDVDKDGVYTAEFDQAAQWWGECWE